MSDLFYVSVCIGCGCDDDHACLSSESGLSCHWRRVDRHTGLGVCSECAKLEAAWDKGDRKPRRAARFAIAARRRRQLAAQTITLEMAYAMDDSCQFQFWAKGHWTWGEFNNAVSAEVRRENRDIPDWVIRQAPVRQRYQRVVPSRGSIVSDQAFHYQDQPGRGATPVTVMEFWYPLHAFHKARRAAAATASEGEAHVG